MQKISYRSIFTNFQISTLSRLGGVSGTNDWSEEKKKKKKEKSDPFEVSGYDQMKVESLCTSKLQTFETFS